jgi:phage-related tail fiber protein
MLALHKHTSIINKPAGQARINLSQEDPSEEQSSVAPRHRHPSMVRTVSPTMTKGSVVSFVESMAMDKFRSNMDSMKGEVSDLKADLSEIKQLLLALKYPAITMGTSVGTEPSGLTTGTGRTYGSIGVS